MKMRFNKDYWRVAVYIGNIATGYFWHGTPYGKNPHLVVVNLPKEKVFRIF
jgi:hypothetical protein